MTNKLNEYQSYINSKLSDLFPKENINGKSYWYNNKTGEYFKVTGLAQLQAIVVEYASKRSDIKKNILEDGDAYDINLFSKDDLVRKLLEEISA